MVRIDNRYKKMTFRTQETVRLLIGSTNDDPSG